MIINKLLTVLVFLTLILVLTNAVGHLVPWYSQNEPMKIIPNGHSRGKTFKPGEPMAVQIERRALIGFEGRITRELVRVHAAGAGEEELYKIDTLTSIERGKRIVVLYYRIPTTEDCPPISDGIYMWRGSLVYKPMGFLEKTYFFRTETFRVVVPD